MCCKTIFAIRMSALARNIDSICDPTGRNNCWLAARPRVLQNILLQPGSPTATTYRRYPAAVAYSRTDLNCSPTCVTNRRIDTAEYEPPILSNDAFAKYDDRQGPRGASMREPSMDHILFAVFSHENKSRGAGTPFLLIQKQLRLPFRYSESPVLTTEFNSFLLPRCARQNPG